MESALFTFWMHSSSYIRARIRITGDQVEATGAEKQNSQAGTRYSAVGPSLQPQTVQYDGRGVVIPLGSVV